HSAQSLDTPLAPLLVAVHDDLGVRSAAKTMAGRLEFSPQLPEVENLAVEGEPHGLVLVDDRLFAGLEVDDREAPVAEPRAALDSAASPVGTPVDHRVREPSELESIHRGAVEAHASGDAAHGLVVPPELGWRGLKSRSRIATAPRVRNDPRDP